MLMKFHFQGQILKKYSHIKFNEYPPSGSRVVPYGLTDGRTERKTDGWYRQRDGQRQEEANSRFLHFCERTYKPYYNSN
jgi:hypothetical protein